MIDTKDATIDIQQKYLNRFQDLQTDLELKTSENSRLRYDFQFLKSEYTHAKEDWERKLHENQQTYKTNLESLATERQELIIAKDVALSKSKKDLDKAKSEIDFNLKRIADLQEEINTLVRDKNQVLEDYQSSQRQHKNLDVNKNEDLRKLELQNQSLLGQLQSLQSDLEKTRSQLTLVQEKCGVESRRCDDYESELRKTRNELNATVRDLEKAIKRETTHRAEIEKQFNDKIKSMEALLEVANTQRNEQRRLASEIEVKCNKSVEQIRNKFQIQVNELSSEKDQLTGELSEAKANIEMLNTEKKEDRREFENNINELNDQIANLSKELEKSVDLSKKLRVKADNATELEQQLHATKIQVNELNSMYEQFKVDALEREKKLVDEKNEASSSKMDAIKELSNERQDINRNLDILKDEHNRKNLKMLEEKHNLENTINDKEKTITDISNKNSTMKKREAKIKKSVTNKFDNYKKKIKKLEHQNAKNEREIAALKRLNGVPLEEYQKLENQLRDLKNKCNDFKHASSMYELKMFNPVVPGLVPPPPNPNLMTQMALNKIRSDQDQLNRVVSGINSYNKDRTNLNQAISKAYPIPNKANSMVSTQASTLPNRFQSLSNFHVAGFSRNNSNTNNNNNKSMIQQLSIQATQTSPKRTLSIEDGDAAAQSSTRSQTVVMSTTAIQQQIDNLDNSDIEDPTTDLKSFDNDLDKTGDNYQDDFEIVEVDLDQVQEEVNNDENPRETVNTSAIKSILGTTVVTENTSKILGDDDDNNDEKDLASVSLSTASLELVSC